MRINPFKALTPKLSLISSIDSFFSTVKVDYLAYKEAGFFESTKEPMIVVYTISRGGHTYHGIVVANDLRDIADGKIVKHEKTLAHKEQHMIRLTLERRAQIKPVLLGYKTRSDIDEFISKVTKGQADYTLEFAGGELHELYGVRGAKAILQIQKLFKAIPKAYIADGHHRCSTGQHLSTHVDDMDRSIQLDSLLAMYLPFSDLDIYDYNRLIDVTDNIATSELMARLARICTIKPLGSKKKPRRKHEITTCIDGQWYRLRWKKRLLQKANRAGVVFDTALLNRYVLRDILNIQDVRTDPHIEYVSGVKGLKSIGKAAKRNHDKVAFCLYPVELSDLVATADMGATLPPKSTWFEPRMKNGVIGIEI